MNRYQVILSNNDVLAINADGVERDGTYLFFYELARDADGNTKPIDGGPGLECNKVAEFASWNGWNCMGQYTPPEVPPKPAETKTELTGADIALQLQDAIKRQASGDREPKVTYDPYQGRS